MNNTNPAVDAYIAKSAPFAQPVLEHLRKLIHKAVPGVEEQIKWSMPFFVSGGIILANIAAFKAHCSFGIWGDEISAMLKADGYYSRAGMGKLGRIESVKDLPSDKDLIAYLRAGAALIASGTRTKSYSRPSKAAKPAPVASPELLAALKKNRAAHTVYEAFPDGARREYVDWINEARRDETRDKRITQAIEWIAEGKRRNWKYENC